MTNQQHHTFLEQLAEVRRARRARLRLLWQMTVQERIAAMRRGELTYEQLAAWSARYPDQVPRVNGEFEWIAALTPEAAECPEGLESFPAPLPASRPRSRPASPSPNGAGATIDLSQLGAERPPGGGH
jgi:hypothetical protein